MSFLGSLFLTCTLAAGGIYVLTYVRMRFGELPPVSRRAQPERQRDPGAAVENQIDPDQEADHPKS